MSEPQAHARCLLVCYFEEFLRHQQIDEFLAEVDARYSEATLSRLLVADDVQARRAAVMALGHLAGYRSNAAVAKALHDPDPTVRELAVHALWAIWFRADTAANNETLEEVRMLISRGMHPSAVRLATELIDRAPDFAEAYNQRAIAQFNLDRFEQSAADCRSALERNPYHIGALGGLAQCYLLMEKRQEALATLKRAARVQPYDQGLKTMVQALEAEGR